MNIHLTSPLLWLILLATLSAIAVITYIYSQKNLQLTCVLTGVSALALLAAVGYDTWDAYLHNNFIARFDALGVPYRYSRPGWLGLIDAWPFWLVPSVFFSAAFVLLFSQLQKSSPIEEEPAPVLPVATPTSGLQTRHQLELERLKKSLMQTNERLAEALAERGKEEAKVHVLQASLQELGQGQVLRLQNKVQLLELEIAAKSREIARLTT